MFIYSKFQIPGGTKELESAKFAQLWNKIITSFRKEDLINDRGICCLFLNGWIVIEGLLSGHHSCLPARSPLLILFFFYFLLIPIAVDMAKDSNGKDLELQKRILGEDYMHFAVRECYCSFKNIIKYMVEGDKEKTVINRIFDAVQTKIDEKTLISDLNFSALPILYDKFVDLINLLVYLLTLVPQLLLILSMHSRISCDF
ncbi:hypothetical protein Taro_005448 [Colocasia esculenta]|uniref:Callose synthase helical domain-containing protein n=1 Tax=Colocasia esculenta TaxID=4460 RepID=A0A843TPZ6_COLES|nr:hypothetical protein [Colocasia esculenta]